MSLRKLLTLSLVLLGVAAVRAQDVERVEYFLDTDPGYGKGRVISNIHLGDNQLTFDVSDAAPGPHVLSVRVQDSEGHWSQTMNRPLFIDRLQDIVYAEYFIDNDPGVGLGKPIALPDLAYKAHLDFSFDVSTLGLAVGEHEFFVRGLDALGQWTDLVSRRFTIYKNGGGEEPVSNGDLNRIEYFFDTDPGYGKGFPLENPSTGTNTYKMSFASTLPGVHVLSLRAQDDVGHWSQTLSRTIYVLEPLAVVAVEYFFDTDPGEGKATAVTLPSDLSTPFAFEIPVAGPSLGAHKFYVRAKGQDGIWSPARMTEIIICNEDAIESVGQDVTPDGSVYNLSGQQLSKPQRGVNIVGGRKVIIK